MSKNNKSYKIRKSKRINTEVQKDQSLVFNFEQDYDILEILSLKIDTDSFYKLHTSHYGCLVGRVLANGGVGVPNVKISIFIEMDDETSADVILKSLYPYKSTQDKNQDGVRYNLLPDKINDVCHQDIGTFPRKRLVLDDDNVIEIFDKYYKYTTVTNNSGDYMLFGIPTGQNTLHMDLDLSDIGMLSQKPRDLFYKGYTKSQFENASQFKKDTNLNNLTQVISQDASVYVYPFWGDDEAEDDNNKQVRITRKDIDVNYKFEPTCIFIGSLVADEKSQGFSKNCIPTDRMGKMDRLTTGNGTIEMIRKTPEGYVESFSIQGNDLIDGNGTWCYQIPMNLDYMKTDEFGNFVAAENELTGIPTRAKVRFRISLADYESDSANAHLCKMLVPNNPENEPDYVFGSYTKEESFKDLFWNNVYSVKQYIPRIQRVDFDVTSGEILAKEIAVKSRNFSGIKMVNANGSNNPIPYNNIRVKLTMLFMFQCIMFKSLLIMTKLMNALIRVVAVFSCGGKCKTCNSKGGIGGEGNSNSCNALSQLRYITLDGSSCPAMEGWYVAPGAKGSDGINARKRRIIIDNTIAWASGNENSGYPSNNAHAGTPEGNDSDRNEASFSISGNDEPLDTDSPTVGDKQSAENKYAETGTVIENGELKETINIKRDSNGQAYVTAREDYFVKCVELQFAQEYEVIQFDFYNDWMNGMLYFPRWFAEVRRFNKKRGKIKACNDNFTRKRAFTQMCATRYNFQKLANSDKSNMNYAKNGCGGNGDKNNKCHKKFGLMGVKVFKKNGGIVKEFKNNSEQYLYYLKPMEYITVSNETKKVNLFATDIILLGNTSECNRYGIPKAVGYPSSTYIMPPPTGQILSEDQEIGLFGTEDSEYKGNNGKYFYIVNKKPTNFGEGENDEGHQMELSGVDWGYNPFTTTEDDKTTTIDKQQGGHFLEIGCLNSMTNIKTCANLQRICELGSEMSQSHYYYNGGDNDYINPTGIISAREIVGTDIRMQFAALNANKLITEIDTDTSYLQYKFVPFVPNNFNGALQTFNTSFNGGTQMFENASLSYLNYRFGVNLPRSGENDTNWINEMLKHHLITSNGSIAAMPVYENSFYFYFGLKDGSTAIDRLYTEYFSECTKNE